MFRAFRQFTIGCALIAACAIHSVAAEPLHLQLDAAVAVAVGGPVNGPADDATFVRRVYLDLLGRIPTVAESKRFRDDKATGKRAKLVDELLVHEQHPQHLAEVLHVMLMERLADHAEWNGWLLKSAKENKPWDAMVREMLTPHEENDPVRGAGAFVSKRLEHYGENPVDYPGLVRDVGRLFLGVDLQCAQCHDHPQIDDYQQIDYQGLYAYFANVKVRDGASWPAVSEGPLTKKLDYQSVFVMKKEAVGPRVPFGVETAIPAFEKGQEFETPPDRAKNQPGVLKFSPLKMLAAELPRAETRGFAKNIVNRLWARMMGRGLVHPLDLHHAANAPSHPELLELLAQEFIAHQYDMRWLLRELALSETYGRSSELPAGGDDAPATSYRIALEKGLSPEQIARSLWTATGPWPDERKFDDLKQRTIKAFAQPPRTPETEFAPSVKGALFLAHDSAVLALLERKEGNLMARLAKLDDGDPAAEELFLAVFGRRPSDQEKADVVELLQDQSTRESGLRRLLWAMLASSEFALSH